MTGINRTYTVALANQKGGVGKTTTAVNLGAALAQAGERVLLVDLDPQGNATTGVGVDRSTVKCGTYEVLGGAEPADAVQQTGIPGLDLMPSTIDLAGAEIELVSTFARENKLRSALSRLIGSYRYIIVDSPPSLGLLTINGLTAADAVLVPIQAEYYALEGLGQLVRTISLVKESLNPDLEIAGVVLTMYDARTKLAEQVASEVRSHFGDAVLGSVIPRSVRLSEAPSYGKPIASYDPGSRGAVAYRLLAREVRERWETRGRLPEGPSAQQDRPSGQPSAAPDVRAATQSEERSPAPPAPPAPEEQPDPDEIRRLALAQGMGAFDTSEITDYDPEDVYRPDASYRLDEDEAGGDDDQAGGNA